MSLIEEATKGLFHTSTKARNHEGIKYFSAQATRQS